MIRPILLLTITAISALAADYLIVADEFPAMQGLAKQLQGSSEIIDQSKMPADLSGFKSVVVYIHQNITPAAEAAFIQYTDNGGRLVLLHHSISSGKRKNKQWLPWLGVELPDKPYEQGGYKWIDPADFEFFNAAGERIQFHDSEIYMNHVLSGPRTLMWSIRYKGVEQPSGAWRRPSGKGEVFYFMAGHKPNDFDIPRFARDVTSAIEGRLSTTKASSIK